MNKKLGYGALAVGSAVAIGGIGVAATIIPLSLWKTMIASDDSSAKGDVLIGEDLSLEPTLDLKNKVCFITGSNSGLGKATAKLLSSSGALVVLACKRGIPGDSEPEDVAKEIGNSVIGIIDLDLGDFASIRNCCQEYKAKKFPPIDIVILNAGVCLHKFIPTKHGLESMFGINYVGHWLLCNKLIEEQVLAPHPRFVGVCSESHHLPPSLPQDQDTAAQLLRSPFTPSVSSALELYGQSKLFLTSFLCELRRRYPNVSCAGLCPGAMGKTNVVPQLPPALSGARTTIKVIMAFCAKGPDEAAKFVVKLAGNPHLKPGQFIYEHVGTRKMPRKDTCCPIAGAVLWDQTSRLISELENRPKFLPKL